MTDATYSAELRLVLEVLRRAMLDSFLPNSLGRDANCWLHAYYEKPKIMSCQWVCEQLDLDRAQILKALRKIKDAGLKDVSRKPRYDEDLKYIMDCDAIEYRVVWK